MRVAVSLVLLLGCGDNDLGTWSKPTAIDLGMIGLDDPTLIADLLELYLNIDAWISPDDHHLVFSCDRTGRRLLFEATR